jgi:hypothetical protein
MNAHKFLNFFWVMLIALASCEQEETLQRPLSSSVDPKADLTAKSSTPSRNFEVLDLSNVSSDRDGYVRLRQNQKTGSVLYAYFKNGKIANYQVRKSGGRKVNFIPPGQGGSCPDLYICIHPKTGKYIFYDKCVTDNPCDRQPCPDLWWCIDPVTGNYILYDKCKTDTSPCDKGTPPLIIVSKKYNVTQFCPNPEYTWMIDPETGEYMLFSECDYGGQLFLEIGW